MEMIITMEDLGELDPDLDKHTPEQKRLVKQALEILDRAGVRYYDEVMADELGVTVDVAHAIMECLGVAGLLIPGGVKTPTMTSQTFDTVDEFHEKVGYPAVIEVLRVAALWGPGFDCNPPARTPAAIRQAAYDMIDGTIGDLDADQLFQGWIEQYGPLPTISDTVDNKIKMTYGRVSKTDADEEERAGGTIH